MSKARLVKKEDIRPEMLQKRKGRGRRAQKQPVRTAVEVTREWISKQRTERPGAREAFEALFAKAEPQSA
ncbi:MAG TPA: hypothetical protein VNQ79_14790 [Blastocatellia bacterium]|nr:hypothetical protein [Blastocatellia bacterium]